MRKNKKIIVLILIFLAALTALLTLSGRSYGEMREVSIYFVSRDGSSLVPKMYEISAEDSGELYEKMADILVGTQSGKKYQPLADKNTRVIGIENDGGSLTIDFSKEYKSADLISSYAVIKTFAALPEVREVRVTCGGEEILKSNGEALGFITADKINTESDDDCATGLRLYFANAEKDALTMEYRKINITDTQPTEQYIVAELIKGPKIKGNERLLDSGTGIIAVETTDGTCYVNFKQNFIDKNIASQDKGRLIVYSIVNSLTELESVQNVQFLIEGKKTDSFGDVDISELFERNDTLLESNG